MRGQTKGSVWRMKKIIFEHCEKKCRENKYFLLCVACGLQAPAPLSIADSRKLNNLHDRKHFWTNNIDRKSYFGLGMSCEYWFPIYSLPTTIVQCSMLNWNWICGKFAANWHSIGEWTPLGSVVVYPRTDCTTWEAKINILICLTNTLTQHTEPLNFG